MDGYHEYRVGISHFPGRLQYIGLYYSTNPDDEKRM